MAEARSPAAADGMVETGGSAVADGMVETGGSAVARSMVETGGPAAGHGAGVAAFTHILTAFNKPVFDIAGIKFFFGTLFTIFHYY